MVTEDGLGMADTSGNKTSPMLLPSLVYLTTGWPRWNSHNAIDHVQLKTEDLFISTDFGFETILCSPGTENNFLFGPLNNIK